MYGKQPDFVRLQVAHDDGTLHTTMDIPTSRAAEAASSETVVRTYVSILMSPYTKAHDLE
jgi:hypothetical protein